MAKFALILAWLATATAMAQTQSAEEIMWPEGFKPSESKFFIHNEIEINAPPEKVWALLIDALAWESWYEGASQVSFADPTDSVLRQDGIFNWKTMGLQFTSVVKEFEENRFLAWESNKKSIQGYHVWLIVPTPTGCKVITEETQNGWLTFMEKTFQRHKLEKLHDVWLAEMKKKCETQIAGR
jgi:uncharacterized protein YndB with AHSA1/START domain